jgi:hypothetical protein
MGCVSFSQCCHGFALAMALVVSGLNDARADITGLETAIREKATALEDKLIAWRRDIHEHPELGDQEVRTARLVADHLRNLGFEVRTEVARTGVVGILKGAKPGLTVALRADMDALPVKEPPELPFASKFFVDESALVVGTRTLAFLAVNFLNSDIKKGQARKKLAALYSRRTLSSLQVFRDFLYLAKQVRVFTDKLPDCIRNKRISASPRIGPAHKPHHDGT